MGTSRTLILLLLAGIVAVSAKPHRAPSYEERLYNRRGIFDDIGDTFEGWGDAIADTASNVVDTVGEVVSDAKDEIVDAFDKRAMNPVNVMDNVPEQMVPDFRFDAASFPEERLYNRRGFFDDIGDTFEGWGDAIADTASNVVDTVGEVVSDAKDEIVDAFDKRELNPVMVNDNIPEQMVPGFRFDAAAFPEERLYNRRGGWFEGWGDTLSGWGDAIADTASDVGDTLKGWGNSVGDAVVDAKDEIADAFDKREMNQEPVNIRTLAM